MRGSFPPAKWKRFGVVRWGEAAFCGAVEESDENSQETILPGKSIVRGKLSPGGRRDLVGWELGGLVYEES